MGIVSSTITHRSKSNLAFALRCLPAEKRRDMVTFYAFCRVIDDIADHPDRDRDQKAEQLDYWRRGIDAGFATGELEHELVALVEKYGFSKEYLLEIIGGVAMDLEKNRYRTFEELKQYCYRVACVVGLVSVEIFGYRDHACREYAVELGYALQITNILRDVRQDLELENRIYLPQEDFVACGYGEDDLRSAVYDERFVCLMHLEAERAEGFFARAVSTLPEIDRRSMVAAEIMRKIYAAILARMRGDGFRVFETRYRLSRARMLAILARTCCCG